MKIVSLKTALTTNDLWVSMIENWGEANKEYEHCGGNPSGGMFPQDEQVHVEDVQRNAIDPGKPSTPKLDLDWCTLRENSGTPNLPWKCGSITKSKERPRFPNTRRK